jgi:murein DD-endopeptidase MepM/ murein hydrolase activator NlpD
VTGRRVTLALPALLLARPVCAVELPTSARQGDMVIGQGGMRGMALDGRALRVTPNGAFVFGLGRDHGASATLSLPRGETRSLRVERRLWDVQHITGLPPAQVTPDDAALARIQQERTRLAAARAADSDRTDWLPPMAWPARGRISGVFGSQRVLNGQPRQPHYGLDVAGPVGTPISAAWAGRVTLAADFFFFGKLVVIDHGHGINTLYAHLSAIDVAEGAVVAQGAPIGAMGATGRVTGPHLHFSLSWYAVWMDPQPRLAG